MVDALKRHRITQKEQRLKAGSRWQDTGYVFTSPIGTPLDARNVIRRFHTALERAELPSMRWHELRHSAASLAPAQGASMKEVQALLGHAQIGTTMNLYTPLMPEAGRGVADRMDEALYSGT